MRTLLTEAPEVGRVGTYVVVAPTVLDASNAHAFRLLLHDALDAHQAVTVDLCSVAALSPSGAAVLVGAARRAAAAGRSLTVTGIGGAAFDSLKACGLQGWLYEAARANARARRGPCPPSERRSGVLN